MAEKKKDPQRFVTPLGRISFPNVFKPKAFEEDDEPVYDTSILIPLKKGQTFEQAIKKDPRFKPIRLAIKAAKIAKWGDDESKWPRKIHISVFKDGNDWVDQEGYKNTVVFTPRNRSRPQIVDQKLQPITEEDKTFYAGCFALVACRAYAYEYGKVKKGVTLSLESIQKHSDGKRFDGRLDAGEVFEELEDTSDDEENYDDDAEDGDDADW